MRSVKVCSNVIAQIYGMTYWRKEKRSSYDKTLVWYIVKWIMPMAAGPKGTCHTSGTPFTYSFAFWAWALGIGLHIADCNSPDQNKERVVAAGNWGN